MTLYTVSGKVITLSASPLAPASGEGTVYKIINTLAYPNHCAKIYHLDKRTPQRKNKLQYLVTNRPPNFSGNHYSFCWPVEILFNGSGDFLGFIMPLATPESEKAFELSILKSKRLLSSWQKFDRDIQGSFKNRVKVCINIAIAIHSLHAHKKFTVIDLKPQNILLNIEGHISIIDVDSFQVYSDTGILHHADVLTLEYVPIEYYSLTHPLTKANEYWDRFALAVSFYEILLGIHPYTSTCKDSIVAPTIYEKIENGLFVHGQKKDSILTIAPPHKKYNSLPPSLKSLFSRAFNNDNPSGRPSAEEWGKTLFDALN